ncbi:MAG: GGDEF domain-containing protein [Tissierellia bacterium]|nr:GGDEF domain-containing protein [Tissierellia bacterium]
MDITFKEQISKLIEDEDNFEYFRDIAIKHMTSKPYFVKNMLDELMIFSLKNNLHKISAWTYYYLGWHYMVILEYDKAVKSFFRSKEVFEEINDKKGLIYACNGLTNVYCEIGQFKLANEWGIKGINLCEETKEKEPLAMLLINTGINYIQMKNFYESKEIFNTIKMMDFKLFDSQILSCKLALAEIEINIGNPCVALKYLNETLDLESDEELSGSICETYKLKGMAYFKLEEYNVAEKEFIKSYDLSNLCGYINQKCSVMVEWSKLYLAVGRYDVAIELLEEVVKISKSKDFNILLRESYHILYTIYKKNNHIENALYYLEEYICIDDKMYDYEQNHLIAKMNIKNSKKEADLYKLLYDKTELLSSIGQKITSSLDLNSIIETISEEIDKVINADIFGISFYNNDKQEGTYYFFNQNNGTKNIVPFNIDENNTFSSLCIKNKENIIVNNKEVDSAKYNVVLDKKYIGKKEKSMLYTPLIIKENVIGVITVQSYFENTFTKNDLDTLKIIASYSAIAIHNALSYKRVEEIAIYDNMTGFLTRFEIIRLGELVYKKYKDDNKGFSIIMIDIDDFKLINDTYGHVKGDKAINMVTESISKCIRTTDYIGRYGGDEFLLICPGLKLCDAVEIAERIRRTISKEIYVIDEGILINITLSLGVYEFSKYDLSFIDGVQKADKRLYKAKRDSKNKVTYK